MRRKIRVETIEASNFSLKEMKFRIVLFSVAACLAAALFGLFTCFRDIGAERLLTDCRVTFLNSAALGVALLWLQVKKDRKPVVIILSAYATFVMIPSYWLNMDGITGAVPFLALLISWLINNLMDGKSRYFMLASITAVVASLTVNDFLSEGMKPYHEKMVVHLIAFSLAYIIITALTLAVNNERSRITRLFLESSYIDSMTGVWNNRYLTEELPYLNKRWEENELLFTVVLFDIDRFKYINDTYGHQTGDEVLRQVAGHADSIAGEMGSVFRYGGDEFVIILPSVGASEAQPVIHRLRAAVETLKAGGAEINITLSFGISDSRDAENRGVDVIKLADERMYINKVKDGDSVTGMDLEESQ